MKKVDGEGFQSLRCQNDVLKTQVRCPNVKETTEMLRVGL